MSKILRDGFEDFVYGSAELFGGVWFEEEVLVGDAGKGVFVVELAGASGEDDFERGKELEEFGGKIGAVFPGHFDVGEEEVDLARWFSEAGVGFFWIFGGDYGVAGFGEGDGYDFTDGSFVFDYQNRPLSPHNRESTVRRNV